MKVYHSRLRCWQWCVIHFVVTSALVLFACQFLKFSAVSRLLHDPAEVGDEWELENDQALQDAELSIFSRSRRRYRQYDFLKLNNRFTGALAFTIITVKRSVRFNGDYEPRYLSQVFAKFIEILSRYEPFAFRPVKLLLCNVEEFSKDHLEASAISSYTGVHTFTRYDKKGATPSEVDDAFVKEGDDYAYCLNQTFRLPSVEYAVMVEDDAMPHANMLEVLLRSVHHYFETQCARNIAYVRLYHPDRVQSYISWELHRWVEFVSICSLLASCGTFITARFCPYDLRRSRHVLCLWCYLFFHAAVVLSCIDRVYVLRLRSLWSYLYSVVPAPSCCTPAVLYTKQHYRTVSTYLAAANVSYDLPKDTALDGLQRHTGLRGVLLEPNVFSHIGTYSSVRFEISDPT